jgi:hypothetical protein
LPLPLDPAAIVTHAAALVADHVQPAVAVTRTVPVDAPDPALTLDGLSE